jgi:hypothetical protein
MRVAIALLLPLLLASCTEHNPDYAPDAAATCAPGARSCSGATVMVCVGGAEPRLEAERTCPAPSMCEQGTCAPGTDVCQGSCGGGQVCTVFVASGTTRLATFCAQPTGTKAGGQLCSRNDECETGLCVGGGKVPVCFRSCSKSRGCPATLRCVDVKVTVDGVSGAVSACVL